jgi:hypothetical protein
MEGELSLNMSGKTLSRVYEGELRLKMPGKALSKVHGGRAAS